MRSNWRSPGCGCLVHCCCIVRTLSAVGGSEHTAANPAWPHTLTVNGATVVVYQPQAIEWPTMKR